MYVFVQVLSCFQKGERSGNQIKEKVWKSSYNLKLTRLESVCGGGAGVSC